MTAPTIYDAHILNVKNDKRFYFRGVSPIKNRVSQPSMSIPFVSTTAQNNLLFRFTGQTEEISFNFAIYSDGQDISGGTHSSTINSIAEQITYFKTEIFKGGFDERWTFWDIQARYAESGITVNIEDVEFENPAGGVTIVTGTIKLRRGRMGLV